MARVLPRGDPALIRVPSERLVFERLLQLPDDFLVLHSFPWLRPDRWRPDSRKGAGAALGEGEADFVIVHPQLGLLVLEVKGGHPVLEGGQWWYDARRKKEMKDPFAQAARNMHALLGEITEKANLTSEHFVFGYGVVFPMARYEGVLPANARDETLIDSRGLADIERAIRRLYAAWTARPRPLDDARRRAIEVALLPRLRLLRVVGPEIEAAESSLVQLTQVQQTVALGLLAHPRVLVEGAAGSGKTLLALEHAVRRASAGDRVLLTCYNKHLAQWMSERAASDPRLAKVDGDLSIIHFHGLAADLCRQAGVAFTSDDAPNFWSETAPELMLQAISVLDARQRLRRYDTVIIDEGQDFHPLWWTVLEDLGNESGYRLAVFRDREQALFTDGDAILPDVTPFELNINCRNTRWISSASARLIEALIEIHVAAPMGERPELWRATDAQQQRAVVEDRIGALLGHHALTPRQIALIGSRAWSNGSLSGVKRMGGAPLTDDAAAWRRGEGLLCTTARAFKGLEADVIVLYDLGELHPLFTERDLYVACTRAKHRLILVIEDKQTHKRLSTLLDTIEVQP